MNCDNCQSIKNYGRKYCKWCSKQLVENDFAVMRTALIDMGVNPDGFDPRSADFEDFLAKKDQERLELEAKRLKEEKARKQEESIKQLAEIEKAERAEAQRIAKILETMSEKERLQYEIQLAILDQLRLLNAGNKNSDSVSAISRGILGFTALMALDE